MTDKKVGELWRRINQDCKALDECPNHGDTVKLIRKLVEEREASYCFKLPENTLAMALRDFGIDPKDWEG